MALSSNALNNAETGAVEKVPLFCDILSVIGVDFKQGGLIAIGNQERWQEELFVSILFSAPEKETDLKMIVEKWSKLSVELRKAIVRMIS